MDRITAVPTAIEHNFVSRRGALAPTVSAEIAEETQALMIMTILQRARRELVSLLHIDFLKENAIPMKISVVFIVTISKGRECLGNCILSQEMDMVFIIIRDKAE
jgi:hypothetical protein